MCRFRFAACAPLHQPARLRIAAPLLQKLIHEMERFQELQASKEEMNSK